MDSRVPADQQDSSHGYTLMEIVIVIAIVSLLIAGLLVFISTAQRSGRDAQRRDGLAKVEIALEQWAATHSGTYLDASTTRVVRVDGLYAGSYLGQDVVAPSGGGAFTDDGNSTVTLGEMVIRDASGGTTGTGYCVMTQLEGNAGMVYGATSTNKNGHQIASPATCS